MVCLSGEPLRSTTRVPPDSATFCQSVFSDSKAKPFECGEYSFAKRRIPVSPALVTSALSLRKLSKARCHTKDTGLLVLTKSNDETLRRRRSSEYSFGLVAEMPIENEDGRLAEDQKRRIRAPSGPH